MNPTRWAFLYHGIQRADQDQRDGLRLSLSQIFGSMMIPVRDKDTGKLRAPQNLDEIAPILPAMARKEYFDGIIEMWQKENAPETVPEGIEERSDFSDMETGLEFLDKPIDLSKMSEADRRLYMQAAGVILGEKPGVEEANGDSPKTQSKKDEKAGGSGSSFVLDD